MKKWDVPPHVSSAGAIPWTSYGGTQICGSQVPLVDFTGGGTTATLAWDQIAASMQTDTTEPGRTIIAAANVITAELCTMTGGKPADVCTSKGVTAAAATLPN
jgi:hypothetical protein